MPTRSPKSSAKPKTPNRAGEASQRDPRAPAFVETKGTRLTTNQGAPIADNQNSLKAGVRGPTLLEDFVLREKITHFDHERIPERIVHARGSAAHGFFEPYKSHKGLTRAKFLSDPKTRTPVFARFSTVAGGSSSADTVRDVRGFAVKFYTQDGNFDLVGNNIPVFFIQDAMKFPDLVHSVKMEPHHGMPQAASAHDTFWDFVSLMPESTHMLMWAMSDRAIPRSLRMMQGFGIHTFKLVNDAGDLRLVKFHWKPLLGTHSFLWDEAQQLCGRDADFHRRDLWESIERGAFPEWEFGVQVLTEDEALALPFDVLDATKLIPEEMFPVQPLGRMVLNRNPDNFFAETEQVAFHPGHVVPGIDFSNDPLLQGRLFSYTDTQLIRLGGPNFHQIPVNRPQCPFHNLQRDGHMQQMIPKGRVAYEPASLDGGAPGQTPPEKGGFETVPEASGDKVRARPELFFDHFSQATLFWRSQTPVEQDHIVGAFSFELGKLETPAVRQRMVNTLGNVDEGLANAVAQRLGLSVGEALTKPGKFTPPLKTAPSLSLINTVYPTDTRCLAILIADGVDAADVDALKAVAAKANVVVKIIAPTGKPVTPARGKAIAVDHRLATVAAVLFDALAVPGGPAAIEALRATPGVFPFLSDFHRHLKPVWIADDALALYKDAHLPTKGVSGVSIATGSKGDVAAFVKNVARRFFDRVLPVGLRT